ncbi:hypothetical protein B0H14DRAFT_842956 [Mycena olivaceomarginata]|nr:hypothetical protein B0H14DRAFT_842956 [Mycena olivaceomarginata]
MPRGSNFDHRAPAPTPSPEWPCALVGFIARQAFVRRYGRVLRGCAVTQPNGVQDGEPLELLREAAGDQHVATERALGGSILLRCSSVPVLDPDHTPALQLASGLPPPTRPSRRQCSAGLDVPPEPNRRHLHLVTAAQGLQCNQAPEVGCLAPRVSPCACPRHTPLPLVSLARRVNAALDSMSHPRPIGSASTSRWCLRPHTVADTLSPSLRLGRAQASSTRAASAVARRTRLGLEHHTHVVSLAPPFRPSPLWAPCCPFAHGAESSSWPLHARSGQLQNASAHRRTSSSNALGSLCAAKDQIAAAR